MAPSFSNPHKCSDLDEAGTRHGQRVQREGATGLEQLLDLEVDTVLVRASLSSKSLSPLTCSMHIIDNVPQERQGWVCKSVRSGAKWMWV